MMKRKWYIYYLTLKETYLEITKKMLQRMWNKHNRIVKKLENESKSREKPKEKRKKSMVIKKEKEKQDKNKRKVW